MVTFANGKTIETIAVIGGRTQFQNAMRKTLEIRAARDETSFEELKELYTDSGGTVGNRGERRKQQTVPAA